MFQRDFSLNSLNKKLLRGIPRLLSRIFFFFERSTHYTIYPTILCPIDTVRNYICRTKQDASVCPETANEHG